MNRANGVHVVKCWRRRYGRALGKRKGARAIFIGTRPAAMTPISSPGCWLKMIRRCSLPGVLCSEDAQDSPLHVRTWRRANPGLGFGMPDIEVLRAEARLARRDPAEMATFRALRLNGGTSEVQSQMLIDADTWRGVEVEHCRQGTGLFPWEWT